MAVDPHATPTIPRRNFHRKAYPIHSGRVRCATDESTCTPDSVAGDTSPAGGHPSRPTVAGRLQRPTRRHRAGRPRTPARTAASRWRPFLALLRVGFTKPSRSPGTLVGSYPTVSPLPGRGPAVCFLWHFPADHPGLPLATTLPCGVRTFLGDSSESSRSPGQLVRPIILPPWPPRACAWPRRRWG
jgi:hypothetical protein